MLTLDSLPRYFKWRGTQYGYVVSCRLCSMEWLFNVTIRELMQADDAYVVLRTLETHLELQCVKRRETYFPSLDEFARDQLRKGYESAMALYMEDESANLQVTTEDTDAAVAEADALLSVAWPRIYHETRGCNCARCEPEFQRKYIEFTEAFMDAEKDGDASTDEVHFASDLPAYQRRRYHSCRATHE